MERFNDIARSAQRILVPKSKDARRAVEIFTQQTGIEVPKTIWDKCVVDAGGRNFRLAPGADMPDQVAADWADLGIISTEIAVENGNEETVNLQLSDEELCRYSIIALESFVDQARELCFGQNRYLQKSKEIPATFPRLLSYASATRDLPFVPLRVPVSGKGEYAMRASGIGIMAERVASGATIRSIPAIEVMPLAKIVTEIVVRKEMYEKIQQS